MSRLATHRLRLVRLLAQRRRRQQSICSWLLYMKDCGKTTFWQDSYFLPVSEVELQLSVSRRQSDSLTQEIALPIAFCLHGCSLPPWIARIAFLIVKLTLVIAFHCHYYVQWQTVWVLPTLRPKISTKFTEIYRQCFFIPVLLCGTSYFSQYSQYSKNSLKLNYLFEHVLKITNYVYHYAPP